MSRSYTNPLPGGIPSTHKEHTESKTTILLPNDKSAFLNPPQQFNRDLSVAVIRAWNERRVEIARSKWEAKKAKKAKRSKANTAISTEGTPATEAQPEAGPSNGSAHQFQVRNIRIIEALSATGLRSIRYAKEVPNVKLVLANDLSPSACEAMRMNVAYNGVEEVEEAESSGRGEASQVGEGGESEDSKAQEPRDGAKAPGYLQVDEEGNLPNGRRPDCRGRVRVNEGDACGLMYAHRDPKDRVEVVDLDPYGTAAPFIDSAIQAVADGGLLCVTCTDTAVFAGSQYPEKAFANYGGASVNAEYCHEVGLRLVLNSLAVAAARYGRCITPLLSFSIDFYCRVFVTVESAPVRVKDVSSNTGIVFVCSHCQSWETQPFGRVVEDHKGPNKKYKSAPKTSKGASCKFCNSTQHVGGPMWLGPIQDTAFAERCLKSIEGQQEEYKTWTRMHGMLTIASRELEDPFYFSCNTLSSFFRSTSAPTSKTVSALLHAGYKVSRSHALAGSIKTNAPRSFVIDIIKEYIKENPVRMDKIAENNPARVLLAREQTQEVDLSIHPDWTKFEKGEKMVFYQVNPLPNWGPAARAKNVVSASAPSSVADAVRAAAASSDTTNGKRKGEEEDQKVEKKTKLNQNAEQAGDLIDTIDDEEAAMNM